MADIEELIERLTAPAYWMSGSSDGHEGENDAPREAAALLQSQQQIIGELREALSSTRAQAKLKGRDLLREEADAVLGCFRPEWEPLATVAKRTGRYSAQQLASRARDLRKRGLVEQRWNEGVMRISEWRAALNTPSQEGEKR